MSDLDANDLTRRLRAIVEELRDEDGVIVILGAPDAPAAKADGASLYIAMLDRLTHRAHVLRAAIEVARHEGGRR